MLPMKVLVADDHRLFRQGLISLMGTRPDIVEVVGQAETGAQAVMLAKLLQPDLVLMDIYMPEGDGLLAAARSVAWCRRRKSLCSLPRSLTNIFMRRCIWGLWVIF